MFQIEPAANHSNQPTTDLFAELVSFFACRENVFAIFYTRAFLLFYLP